MVSFEKKLLYSHVLSSGNHNSHSPHDGRDNSSRRTDINSSSDFPSLSGGPRSQQNSSNQASWNGSAIRQPSTQQQPQAQQQQRTPSAAPSQQSIDQFEGQRSQQPSGDPQDGGDDFPPLGGQVSGNGLGQSSGFGSPDAHEPRRNGQTQLPIRESSNAFQQNQQLPIVQASSQAPQQSSQHSQPPPPASGIKKYANMTDTEKWGLPGFMAVFEARRQYESGGQVDDTLPLAMRNAAVMGQDLSSLGLDLDSQEPLYPTFSPFHAVGSSGSSLDFHDRHVVPDFTLPSAYTVNNVPPLSSRMSAFSDGMFPSSPLRHFVTWLIKCAKPNPKSRNTLLRLLSTPPRRPARTRRARTHNTRLALAQGSPAMAPEGHARIQHGVFASTHRSDERCTGWCAADPKIRESGTGGVYLLRRYELEA